MTPDYDGPLHIKADVLAQYIEERDRFRIERDRYRAALEEIARLSDGQEGRTAQTMMMHGFSPVKAVERSRDIARIALEGGTTP